MASMFPVSSLFNIHASKPYVTIGQMSAWINRAFSGLLIARLLHSVFSWACALAQLPVLI